MKRVPVTVPESVAPGAIGTNFVRTTALKAGSKTDGEGEDPILMLHGFDSSLLEFRRLMPELGELGAEAYAVDVLGWGFTELSGVSSFGAGALFSPVFSIQWLRFPHVSLPPYLLLRFLLSLLVRRGLRVKRDIRGTRHLFGESGSHGVHIVLEKLTLLAILSSPWTFAPMYFYLCMVLWTVVEKRQVRSASIPAISCHYVGYQISELSTFCDTSKSTTSRQTLSLRWQRSNAGAGTPPRLPPPKASCLPAQQHGVDLIN